MPTGSPGEIARTPFEEGEAGMAPAGAVAEPGLAVQSGYTACPYLRSTDGSWRSGRPTRDHRCWAKSPPASLSASRQQRLCLVREHESCDIYAAAVHRRERELARDHIAPDRLPGRFGVQVQPIPLAVNGGSAAEGTGSASVTGVGGRPAALLLAGVAAVVVIALVIVVALAGGHVAPSAPPIAAATVTPRPTPTAAPTLPPTPSPTIARTPISTIVPTAAATPAIAPTPAIARTYRVKSGDTLGSIAAKFGVTKAQLRAVNNLPTPAALRVGQVINIPYPGPSPSPS